MGEMTLDAAVCPQQSDDSRLGWEASRRMVGGFARGWHEP